MSFANIDMGIQLPLAVIGAQTLTLDQRFKKLSTASVQAHDVFTKADHAIRTVLVQGYLLWREFEKTPAALVQLYTSNGLPAPNAHAAPDFAPFIKVQFRIGLPNPTKADIARGLSHGGERNKISNYVAVFDELHSKFEGNEADFHFNPEGKLITHIDDERGVIGIVAKRALTNNAAKLKKLGITPISQPVGDIEAAQHWLAENAMSLFKAAPSSAWSATCPANVFDADRYGVVPYRLTSAGTVEFGPPTNSPDALAVVAAVEAAKLSHIKGHALRLLAEVTATQSYPAKYCPKGFRADLKGRAGKWITDVLMDPGAASGGLPAKRRLVVRHDDILLSTMQTDASVLTVLRPVLSILAASDPHVYLVPDELRLVEDWHESGTLAARHATPAIGLQTAARSRSGDRLMRVTNRATKAAVVLHFWDVNRAADDPVKSGQVALNLAGFTAAWTFSAELGWFAKLQREFLDKWFAMVTGNQLKRQEHMLFTVSVTNSEMSIEFKKDQAGRAPTETIDMDPSLVNATVPAQGISFSVSSKDFATVFYNIARTEVIGPVTVKGDASLIVLEYATSSGTWTTAIPTATVRSKTVVRDGTHFERYGKAIP